MVSLIRQDDLAAFERSRSVSQLVQHLVRWCLLGGLVSILSSCSSPTKSVRLSTGTTDGFYHRLGKQISYSTHRTGELTIENLNSQGSRQNLQRLLNHQVDFALVQLDVAYAAMQQHQVQAIAMLADEYVHVIARKSAGLKTFADLQGKRVAIGAPGSGIRFTANQLLKANNLTIREDAANFEQSFKKLRDRQVDAVIYVGSLGASKKLRQILLNQPDLKFLPLQPQLINNLTILEPGSYRAVTLPTGTYTARPAIPDQNIPTVATATVLVTRPNVEPRTIGLMTWSILATARTYSEFYPELQTADAITSLRKGLLYIHPAAEAVYQQGDPRTALVRYWQQNSDLQAGVFILTTTSIAGLLLQRLRRRTSTKLLATTTTRISELRSLLPDHPQEALDSIEELSQEHRLRFIDGGVTSEVYEQLRQKTQTLTDQCRKLIEQQRRQFVMDTLLLLDDWQASLQTNPKEALQKLGQIKQRYREMLLSDQVDIEAYIELMELTLISLMTLAPTSAQDFYAMNPNGSPAIARPFEPTNETNLTTSLNPHPNQTHQTRP